MKSLPPDAFSYKKKFAQLNVTNYVREHGVPVEYVLFDDEGHGVLKKENEIKGYGQVKKFLDTYLKSEPQ